MAVADRAMQRVLGDRAVWAEESARANAVPLSWPPRIEAEGRAQLLQAFAEGAVESVLAAMWQAETGEPEPTDPRWRSRLSEVAQQLDPADPDVQVVLRVARRAVLAADADLCRDFGGIRGSHRLAGKRDWVNWVKAQAVDSAVRSGLARGEALAALGMSRASAYRAMHRGS